MLVYVLTDVACWCRTTPCQLRSLTRLQFCVYWLQTIILYSQNTACIRYIIMLYNYILYAILGWFLSSVGRQCQTTSCQVQLLTQL